MLETRPVQGVPREPGWRQRGLTVFEVLLALSIFAVFYFILLDVWPLSARAVQQARNVSIAAGIAEQEMEYSVYQGYGGAVDRSGSYTVSSVVNRVPQSVTVSYTVTVSAASGGTKDLLVTVNWSDPPAQPSAPPVNRKLQLETMLGP